MPKNSALLFFNVDSTESPDGLQSVLSSNAFPGYSAELLSELHWAPLYTQCRLAARNPYWTPGFFFFFFLVLSFLTYQNIAGRCVDSVSFQARSEVYQPGDRYSGRGVTGAAAREFDSQSNGRWRVKRPIGDTVVPAARPVCRARRSNQFLTGDARAKCRWLGLGCPRRRGVGGGSCLRARVFGSNSCNYMPLWAEFPAFFCKLWPIFALWNHWNSFMLKKAQPKYYFYQFVTKEKIWPTFSPLKVKSWLLNRVIYLINWDKLSVYFSRCEG